MDPVKAIVQAIPTWSNKLQKEPFNYARQIQSAHNYVTDYSGDFWTFGKSVGDDGNYHINGAAARKRLESLGFINIYDLPNKYNKLCAEVETNFRRWAQKINSHNINSRLDKCLNRQSKEKFRLFIPPNYKPR